MHDKKENIILTPELPEKLKGIFEEEEKIKLQTLTFIKSDKPLDKELNDYENAMDVVFLLTKKHKNRNEDELTIQYIGIRLFNALAISLRLMFTGYYQASFAIQRDMIEIAFLLDYFQSFPSKINEWKKATNEQRIDSFSPGIIRTELDKREGNVSKRRAKRYKMFCEYAAHVSYPGNKLVAPKGLGEVGPFFDEKFFKGCFYDLVLNGFYAVLMYMGHFNQLGNANIQNEEVKFLKALRDWSQSRLKQPMEIDFEKIEDLLNKLSEN